LNSQVLHARLSLDLFLSQAYQHGVRNYKLLEEF
jgi:hypothetical protein